MTTTATKILKGKHPTLAQADDDCDLCTRVSRVWPGKLCETHDALAKAYGWTKLPSLRKRREDLGLSLEELAKRAGVGTTTVKAAESGRHFTRNSTALRLARALGVGVDALKED